jgi:hypothetical protein
VYIIVLKGIGSIRIGSILFVGIGIVTGSVFVVDSLEDGFLDLAPVKSTDLLSSKLVIVMMMTLPLQRV